MRQYVVHAAAARPPLDAGWQDSAWAAAEPLEIAAFRPESSAHRPRTRARLVHTRGGLAGIFRVEDRWVRSVHTGFQDPVYEDSCVEVFVAPRPGHGYFNFEMNAGGALLATHITDHRRVPGGFAAFRPLSPEDGRRIEIRSSLPRRVEPEVDTALDWELSFFLPTSVLEGQVGPIGPLGGQTWLANLYKCGDGTSHPHWAAWSPVDALNFHLPHCFGQLVFEAAAV